MKHVILSDQSYESMYTYKLKMEIYDAFLFEIHQQMHTTHWWTYQNKKWTTMKYNAYLSSLPEFPGQHGKHERFFLQIHV